MGGGFLLSHCSSQGLTPTVRHACLAEVAVSGAVVPIDGYPVSVLEAAWRKRGGSARLEKGILTLTSTDRLTGRTNVVRLEVQPGAQPLHSDQCGPDVLVVSRMALNGQVASEMDTQDGLFPLVENAAAEVGLKEPVLPQAPEPPPGPVSAIQAPPTSGPPGAPMISAPAPWASVAPQTPTAQPAAASAGYSTVYRTCMATGDAAQGVTSAVMSCTGEELARQDAALNQSYRSLMGQLPAGQGAALKAQERVWIRTRDAQCHQQMEDAGGTLGAEVYSKCELDQTVSRGAALAKMAR